MNISDRLNSILQHYNLTANEFANRINVQRSNLSHIFSGRNKPSLDFIEKLHNTFPEISIEWFLFGAGNMLIKENNTYTLPSSKINIKAEENIESLRINYSDTTTEKKIISNSQPLSKKLIFIYSDNTFEEFSSRE